mgnify:CR=1 FL=1
MIGMALGAARAFLAPLLRAVPWWAWLAIALAAWGAWQRHSATVATRQAEQAKASAAAHAAAADAERRARDLEQTYTANVRSAADAYAVNMQAARAAADRARSGLDGLRHAVAVIPACPAAADPAPAGRADATAGLRLVVGECAAALSQVAEAADACDARLTGLQGYIKAIQPQRDPPP